MAKHILIISQYYYPEQFRINDMAEEWALRGYKVSVVTGIPNYPQGKFYSGYGWFKRRKEVRNNVEIIRLPIVARGKNSIGIMLNYLSFVVSGFFWKCFTKLRPDYVFTFGVSPLTQALVGDWIARRRRVPHYLYVQDLWPENIEAVLGIHTKLIISPIRRMMDGIYKRSSKIFATSPGFVKEIGSRIPSQTEKISFLPQYPEDCYVPMPKKVCKELDDNRFKIVFTGNIGVAQGLDILPRSAKILKDSGIEDICFVIIGDGRNRERFEKDIKDNGVQSYFVLLGSKPPEEVASYLALCDLAFVSFMNNALFANTIPAKLQSYMACAMPVLASAIGETERVINESGCGRTCAIGDARALTDAILEMKQMDLSGYAEAARRYCVEFFNKKKLMDELDLFLG